MMLNLAELLNAATVEGEILIRVWDDDAEDYSVNKYLDALTHEDSYLYSWTVKYIYPLLDFSRERHEFAAVVIELEKED